MPGFRRIAVTRTGYGFFVPDDFLAYNDQHPRTVKTYYAATAALPLPGRLATISYPGGKTETCGYEYGTFNASTFAFTPDPDGGAWRETVTTSYPTNLLPLTSYLLLVTSSRRAQRPHLGRKGARSPERVLRRGRRSRLSTGSAFPTTATAS